MIKKVMSLFMVSTMFLLTACGGGSGQAPQNASNDLKELTFVLDWTPNTNHTGLYVAIDQGFFAEEGLDVNVVQPPEDGAETLVASGKADFGVSFQDFMAAALIGETKLPIVAVAALINHNTSGILSRAGEGMDQPKGMAGKKYATWDMPIETAIIKNVVETDGGNFNDVERIPSTVTDEYSALQSNSVDAIWVYYAWGGIACDVKGLATDYFAFKDINAVFDFYSPVLITNQDLIENDPETVEKFLRALQKGYQFAIDDPEAAADILLKAAPELDAELVKASQEWLVDQYVADAQQWGYIDPERWNGFYQWLYQEGLIDEEIPDDSAFTNAYLPQ